MKRLPALLYALAAGVLLFAAADAFSSPEQRPLSQASLSGSAPPEHLFIRTGEAASASVPHALPADSPATLPAIEERGRPLLRRFRCEEGKAVAHFARPPPVSA